MNEDLANFSADLRRVAYWIYDGRYDLARAMLKKCSSMYRYIDKQVACYENIWDEMEKISKLKGGRLKAAERASTASVILLNTATL